MSRQSREKLSVKLSIVQYAKWFPRLSPFIHRNEHRKYLVCVAPGCILQPPVKDSLSLRETAPQRFHSIMIGDCAWRQVRSHS